MKKKKNTLKRLGMEKEFKQWKDKIKNLKYPLEIVDFKEGMNIKIKKGYWKGETGKITRAYDSGFYVLIGIDEKFVSPKDLDYVEVID